MSNLAILGKDNIKFFISSDYSTRMSIFDKKYGYSSKDEFIIESIRHSSSSDNVINNEHLCDSKFIQGLFKINEKTSYPYLILNMISDDTFELQFNPSWVIDGDMNSVFKTFTGISFNLEQDFFALTSGNCFLTDLIFTVKLKKKHPTKYKETTISYPFSSDKFKNLLNLGINKVISITDSNVTSRSSLQKLSITEQGYLEDSANKCSTIVYTKDKVFSLNKKILEESNFKLISKK